MTRKSPENGRGLMNYGLSQIGQGQYTVALDYFTRALVYPRLPPPRDQPRDRELNA